MRHGTCAGRAVGHLATLRLRDQVRERAPRHGGRRREDVRLPGDVDDGNELLLDVVVRGGVHDLVDDHRVRVDEHAVAVGRGADREPRSYDARRARPVLDDDRLSPDGGHLLPEHARKHIHAPPGGKPTMIRTGDDGYGSRCEDDGAQKASTKTGTHAICSRIRACIPMRGMDIVCLLGTNPQRDPLISTRQGPRSPRHPPYSLQL